MTAIVLFRDLKERNERTRKILLDGVIALRERGHKLPPELRDTFRKHLRWVVKGGAKDEIKNINEDHESTDFKIDIVDPLFLGTYRVLTELGVTAFSKHVGGVVYDPAKTTDNFTVNEKRFLAVYGILVLDNAPVPELEADDSGNPPAPGALGDPRAKITKAFRERVLAALREYSKSPELYDRSFDHIIELIKSPTGGAHDLAILDSRDVVRVVRRLVAKRINPLHPALDEHIQSALVDAGHPDVVSPSFIEIELPDLDETAELDIVPDNLRAVQALYFAAILEKGKIFQVCETVVEQFNGGTLPFGRLGDGGSRIFEYWRGSSDRLSEFERRNLYARVFGFPGGDATLGSLNRPFTDLWLSFVSSVSEYVRQVAVEKLLTATTPLVITQEGVRKAARDLASNLSLYGYGVAYFAATELQTQIKDIIAILSSEDVKGAYGSRDMWQVIETVSALYLGGPVTTSRYRTRAEAGAVIIRWLAENADSLGAGSLDALLSKDGIRDGRRSDKPLVTPTDLDLVNACEQWLAVTGTNEARIEEFAQPREAPPISSVPIRMPRIAEDVLGSFGFQAGGNGLPEGDHGGANGLGQW